MKKILLMTIVCFVTLFCTGCVQESYNIEINNKDQISLSETRSIQYKPLESSNFREAIENDFKKYIQKYKTYGYDINTEFKENGFSTVTLKKDNISSIEASKILPKGFEIKDENWFNIKHTLIKDYYKIHLTYNLKNAINVANFDFENFKKSSNAFNQYKEALAQVVVSKTITSNVNGAYILTEYANGNRIMEPYNEKEALINPLTPKAEITIKIPVKASTTNATKIINNTTYQWIATEEQPSIDILLNYSRWDFSNLAIVISLIIVVSSALMVAKRARSGGPVKGL